MLHLLQDKSPAWKQEAAELHAEWPAASCSAATQTHLQLRATRFPSACQTSAPAQTRQPYPHWLSAVAGLS